jgi:polyhydroxybutyrate depolymerase
LIVVHNVFQVIYRIEQRVMMKLSLGMLMMLAMGPLVAVAQQSVLNEFCNGDGPEAITSALPFLDPPLSGEVPQFCVEVAGVSRCFYVLVPEGTTGEVPLVFDIHGTGSCPLFQVALTGWFQLAQANKFVVVFPLGVTDAAIVDNTCFALPGGLVIGDIEASKCCCTLGLDTDFSLGSDMNFIDENITMDTEFLRMAIEAVITNVGPATEGAVSIDRKKVFMAGQSNGCIASLAMAATHSDLVTGVACHAGKSATPFAEDYIPVPTFIVHGLKDGELPYAEIELVEGTGVGFASTPDQFKAIADRNGCAEDILTELLPDGEGKVETRTGCTNNADVTLVTLENAGHSPYLGFESGQELNPGSLPTTIDTSQLAWDFLSMIGETTAPPTEAPIEAKTTDTSNAILVQACTATIMAFFLFGVLL